ncbi:BON domain-containing protein [Ensifer sp. MJa1]
MAGRVNSWSEREAAERAAWSAAEVKSVGDQLTVG